LHKKSLGPEFTITFNPLTSNDSRELCTVAEKNTLDPDNNSHRGIAATKKGCQKIVAVKHLSAKFTSTQKQYREFFHEVEC